MLRCWRRLAWYTVLTAAVLLAAVMRIRNDRASGVSDISAFTRADEPLADTAMVFGDAAIHVRGNGGDLIVWPPAPQDAVSGIYGSFMCCAELRTKLYRVTTCPDGTQEIHVTDPSMVRVVLPGGA